MAKVKSSSNLNCKGKLGDMFNDLKKQGDENLDNSKGRNAQKAQAGGVENLVGNQFQAFSEVFQGMFQDKNGNIKSKDAMAKGILDFENKQNTSSIVDWAKGAIGGAVGSYAIYKAYEMYKNYTEGKLGEEELKDTLDKFKDSAKEFLDSSVSDDIQGKMPSMINELKEQTGLNIIKQDSKEDNQSLAIESIKQDEMQTMIAGQ